MNPAVLALLLSILVSLLPAGLLGEGLRYVGVHEWVVLSLFLLCYAASVFTLTAFLYRPLAWCWKRLGWWWPGDEDAYWAAIQEKHERGEYFTSY